MGYSALNKTMRPEKETGKMPLNLPVLLPKEASLRFRYARLKSFSTVFKAGSEYRSEWLAFWLYKYISVLNRRLSWKCFWLIWAQTSIHCCLISGDNLETAVSVASACGIVFSGMTLLSVDVEELPETTSIISPPLSLDVSDSFQKQTKCKLVFHDVSTNTSVSELEYQKLDKKGNVVFAVTGPSYTKLRENFPPDLLQFFATKCFVYSRMKPDQKTQVFNISRYF